MFPWRIVANGVTKPLTALVNQMLSSGIFPHIFKQADIIPIFKRGTSDNAKNFRPIAILHNLSKIFENILYTRMLEFADANEILPSNQFGFRKNFSTKDAIFYLFSLIEDNKARNLKSCVVFLDLSKAFDMVNHSQLIKVVESLGFRGHISSIIKSYLCNRRFRIHHENQYSKYMPVNRGVPQGGILSPFLYCLYTHDLCNKFSQTIQYADDCSIIIPYNDLGSLQTIITCFGNEINSYFSNLNLSLNPSKTEIVLFGERKCHSFKFCDENIHSTTNTKFLGIFISNDCKFDYHVTKHLCLKIKMLYSSFYNLRNMISDETKRLLVTAYILPHITYANPFLINCTSKTKSILDITYKKAVKILFRLPHRFPTK